MGAKKGSATALQTVLMRLSETGSFAREVDGEALGIFVARNQFKRPVLRLSAREAGALRANEWLSVRRGRPGEYVISALGKAHLARSESSQTPFRDQHQLIRHDVDPASGDQRARVVNDAESPLGWLLKRRSKNGKSFINIDQFAAGERFRQDFTLASMTPRVTASWDSSASRGRRSASSNPAEMSDRVIAAKDRFYDAVDMLGPELSEIVVQVCCHLRGLEEAERNLQWPARSGKVVLGIALSRLVSHYRLVAVGPARGKQRSQSFPAPPDIGN